MVWWSFASIHHIIHSYPPDDNGLFFKCWRSGMTQSRLLSSVVLVFCPSHDGLPRCERCSLIGLLFAYCGTASSNLCTKQCASHDDCLFVYFIFFLNDEKAKKGMEPFSRDGHIGRRVAGWGWSVDFQKAPGIDLGLFLFFILRDMAVCKTDAHTHTERERRHIILNECSSCNDQQYSKQK